MDVFIGDLPCELQSKIYDMTMLLRSHAKPISQALRQDIETYALYPRVREYYTTLWWTVMDSIDGGDYRESVDHLMESDFLLTFFNFEPNHPTGFDNKIRELFPNMSEYELMDELWRKRSSKEAAMMTKRLWIAMDPKSRIAMTKRCDEQNLLYVGFVAHHLRNDAAATV